MKELPENWAKTTIGTITNIKTGKLDANAAAPNGRYPFFTCAEVAARINNYSFDTEAVLLAGNGGFNVKWYSGKFDAYQRTYVIEPRKVDGRFLYRLIAAKVPEITKANRGSTIKYLRVGDITDASVWLPPFAEQKRIADKLDTLLARVDACRERLDRVPLVLKRFRQSVLAAATSGRLTADWREKRVDLCVWSNVLIGDAAFVTKLAGFEYTKYVKYRDGGDLKVLKAENVGKERFKYTDFSTVHSQEVSMLTRSRIGAGDLLMVFVGAGTGQVSMVPEGNSWFLGPNIALIRTNNKILNAKYLEYYCRSLLGCSEIARFMKSTAQPSLSMKTIRQICVALPSILEQQEIVRRVDVLFDYAGRLEEKLTAARNAVECLTSSLLAKAFCGELVEQDINDEPAIELLKRLATRPEEGTKAIRKRKVA